MSTPISAMITCAAVTPIAGDLIEAGHRVGERGDLRVDPVLHVGDVGGDARRSGPASGQQERVVVGEPAGERLPQLGDLARASEPRAISRQHLRVAFARRSARPSSPARRPRRCREATTDSLIWASSSSFSTRCFSAVRAPTRSTRYRVRSRSSRIGLRRHETGPQHLPLGDLAQPHRVQPVGLGPPRQVLDVLGVDQPRLEPGRLQQVERRPPVVAGRLHHHPGHPQLGQPVGHRQQRPGHRRVRAHLLQPPPARPGPGTRTQHTTSALPISSAATRSMISSRSTRRPATRLTSPSAITERHGRPREPQGNGESNPRARSNNEGPERAAPSARLAHGLTGPKSDDVSGRPDPFSARNGPHRQRETETSPQDHRVAPRVRQRNRRVRLG